MNGFVSLLLFASFFYLMMRFGCGAHMVHGNHGDHGGPKGHGSETDQGMGGSIAKDPVCGMEVSTSQGYAKVHLGREYRFCSKEHLDQFDANPPRYISKERS